MWKYLWIPGVLFVELVDCGMIWSKDRGLFVKVARISWFRIYFWMENYMDSVHHSWTAGSAGPR
jgi:hypothetical protein